MREGLRKMRYGRLLTGFILLSAFALTGCEGTKQALGIGNKSGPDEFTVITKAPLIIPPDFSLRPPAPGQKGCRISLPETAWRPRLPGGGRNHGLDHHPGPVHW